MADDTRETRVLAAVVALADSLLEGFDVVDLLTELTERCAELLDVASAGLLLADSRRRLHLMAATSEATHDLEVFELQSIQGPCLECYTSGRAVSVADLPRERTRWPQLVDATSAAGFASVHAVPMRAAGTVLGTLGLFSTETGELNDADQLLAQTLAHIACVAILSDRAPNSSAVFPQLQAVLRSRMMVDQAKGFVRGSLGVSIEDAFAVMRRYARTHRENLTDVASRLLTRREEREAILATMREMISALP